MQNTALYSIIFLLIILIAAVFIIAKNNQQKALGEIDKINRNLKEPTIQKVSL